MESSKHKIRLVKKWNHKIHIYLGLSLLFFIWLFGISGLLLNHHWQSTDFWESREEIEYEQFIQLNGEREQSALANDIMQKLPLRGNIINPGFSDDSIFFNFIIAKPGTRYDVHANINDGKIAVKETKFNTWGLIRSLHKMRNPTLKESHQRYQSIMASIWSFSIDIVSIGLIIICFGGWYLWLQISGKRFYLGIISLTVGGVLCIYFLLL